jgi:formylglycine-generating enzyme required for sulfatase activity
VALARDHPQLPHNDFADCNPAGVPPRVFLSYSHDSEAHRAWVRELAERLVQGGVEVTLDQWDLRPGGDVVRFMDLGIRDADRVLMVCTANYVTKAEERKGGAGYEGMVVTGHVARATDTIKFVPIVRGNSGEPLVPGFLGQRLWLDFRNDGLFEERLEDLLRELHGVPRHPKPPLGRNPFAGPAPLALCPLSVTTARLRREGERWQVERREVRVEACEVELGEGQSLRLIQIPAGEFLMGSPATEPEHSANEGPQHTVRLSGFLIGQTPVTQAQWAVVARWPKLGLDLNPKPSVFRGLRRPVETVSWHEAIEFCRRLSQRSRLSFTLPSEAQWEYACRAGTTTPFAFGSTIVPDLANYDAIRSYGIGPKGPCRTETTDVASFPANDWGVHDMHGTVWEWCLDNWHFSYVGAPLDGSPWLAGGNSKLLRGGSWYHYPRYCRSAFRHLKHPAYAHNRVGLRVVCLPQGSSPIP